MKKQKIVILSLILALIGLSCVRNKPTQKNVEVQKDSNIGKNDGLLNDKQRVQDLLTLENDSSLEYEWYGGTLLSFYFDENEACYLFSASDGADLDASFEEDRIVVYWSYEEPTGHFNKFFKQSFEVNEIPEEGGEFAFFTLKNDTTLLVEYLYKDWVFAVNNHNEEIYFPDSLFLKQR